MATEFEMKPPFLEFPYPPGSLGWRMGWGEHYMEEWRAWYAKLWPQELRDEYALAYPETDDWKGFYVSLGPQDAPPGPVVKMSLKSLFRPLPP